MDQRLRKLRSGAERAPKGRESFDEFSSADLEILNLLWDQFSHMDKWQIRNHAHKNWIVTPYWVRPDF